MQAEARVLAPEAAELKLDLNDGTYCPQACVELVKRHGSRLAFRNYATADNAPLVRALATADGVEPANIYLGHGSGPLLKQAIPHLIRSRIQGSLARSVRYLLGRRAYPIVTPRFTYCKVPRGAAQQGVKVVLLPLSPDDGFRLDPAAVRAELRRGPGLVYVANPNNPTGNVLLSRDDLLPLLQEFPESVFWIDEAYVHYVEPERYTSPAGLAPRFANLVVSRTFSFAYGLAALRVGYLVAPAPLVATLERQVTNYRIGKFQEEMALAALGDAQHLPFVRQEMAAGRALVRGAVDALPGLQSWESQSNFVFCRRTDGGPAEALARAMAARGVLLKTFEPLGEERFDPFFRITLGTADENARVARTLAEVWPGVAAQSASP